MQLARNHSNYILQNKKVLLLIIYVNAGTPLTLMLFNKSFCNLRFMCVCRWLLRRDKTSSNKTNSLTSRGFWAFLTGFTSYLFDWVTSAQKFPIINFVCTILQTHFVCTGTSTWCWWRDQMNFFKTHTRFFFFILHMLKVSWFFFSFPVPSAPTDFFASFCP